MFTDINTYSINNKTDHISEKYIFIDKKRKTKVYIFPILGRIRIWIHIKMKRIRNTDRKGAGSISVTANPVFSVYSALKGFKWSAAIFQIKFKFQR